MPAPRTARRTIGSALILVLLAATMLLASPALANHPVVVEGNCFGPGTGATATGLRKSPVEPGSCGDYDGDGLIGAAEDNDMDNQFGTITAAVAAVAHNGTVTIVEDGTFPEAVRLAPRKGASLTLVAAPGVSAIIDAVVQGEAGNADRAAQFGVIVSGCARCRITLRNVTTRNFAKGVVVRGPTRALLDRVRAEGNLDHGILAIDTARVSIRNAAVNATGFRKDANGVAVTKRGTGVRVAERAALSIADSTVANNRGTGISARRYRIQILRTQVFGNRPNFRLYP